MDAADFAGEIVPLVREIPPVHAVPLPSTHQVPSGWTYVFVRYQAADPSAFRAKVKPSTGLVSAVLPGTRSAASPEATTSSV